MTPTFLVAAFYKFVALPDCVALREMLHALCEENALRGTVLLAPEGINTTLCGAPEKLHRVLDRLREDARFADVNAKFSSCQTQPFARLKVKIKSEIVTLGLPEISPAKAVGTYVKPADWNDLIAQPDVVLVDARNDYEVRVGTFEGAVNPQTRAFRQFPDWAQSNLDASRQQRVAMFCTGGIRCEKATSLLLETGFQNVYHLEGGILKYLEDVPQSESLFRGECFVFDERVALDGDLGRGAYALCVRCGDPVCADNELCEKCVGTNAPNAAIIAEL